MQIFTKKQLWKRQQMQSTGFNQHSTNKNGSEDKDLKRGLEESGTHSLDDAHTRKTLKSSNKVSFHPTAFVVLIPTSHEYHRAGLGEALWWNEADYRDFKLSAMNDMKDFAQKYPDADCAQIFKMYYEALLAEDGNAANRNQDSHLQLSSPSCVVDVERAFRKGIELSTANASDSSKKDGREYHKKLPSPLQLERSDSVQLYEGHNPTSHVPGIDLRNSSSVDSLGPPSPVFGSLLTPSSDSISDSPRLPATNVTQHSDCQLSAESKQNGVIPYLFNAAASMMLSLVQSD